MDYELQKHIVWAFTLITIVTILSVTTQSIVKNKIAMENGYSFGTVQGSSIIVPIKK